MTALEAFEAIEDYYVKLLAPRIALLSANSPELESLCNDIVAITKDETLDGIEFPCPLEVIIEGHDQICVLGTHLDIKQPSLAYLPFNQLKVCALSILALKQRRRGDWYKRWFARYELPFESATIENCIAQLQAASEAVLGKNGAFARAKELAQQGQWRNG